jgi:diacylglycerol kinase (ATP)
MLLKEITRLRNACRYSFDGLKASWNDAGAFRLEACLTPVVLALAAYLAEDRMAFCLLFASWLLVPLAELLNTGIEAATDIACKGEIHPLAKKAKDCGSAAVMLAMFIFVLVWLMMLVDYFHVG